MRFCSFTMNITMIMKKRAVKLFCPMLLTCFLSIVVMFHQGFCPFVVINYFCKILFAIACRLASLIFCFKTQNDTCKSLISFDVFFVRHIIFFQIKVSWLDGRPVTGGLVELVITNGYTHRQKYFVKNGLVVVHLNNVSLRAKTLNFKVQ